MMRNKKFGLFAKPSHLRGKTIKTSAKNSHPSQSFIQFVKTNFGTIAVIWSTFEKQPRVINILLPQPETSEEQIAAAYPDIRMASCAEIDKLTNRIQAFLAGSNIRFLPDDLKMLRLDLCPLFRQQVLRSVFAIPRGQVSSYGRMAKYLGKSGAARAVGTAMATNPFPIIIPCHRIIKSDGNIGEFGSGRQMKKALLEMEGVKFRNQSHVAEDLFWG